MINPSDFTTRAFSASAKCLWSNGSCKEVLTKLFVASFIRGYVDEPITMLRYADIINCAERIYMINEHRPKRNNGYFQMCTSRVSPLLMSKLTNSDRAFVSFYSQFAYRNPATTHIMKELFNTVVPRGGVGTEDKYGYYVRLTNSSIKSAIVSKPDIAAKILHDLNHLHLSEIKFNDNDPLKAYNDLTYAIGRSEGQHKIAYNRYIDLRVAVIKRCIREPHNIYCFTTFLANESTTNKLKGMLDESLAAQESSRTQPTSPTILI